MTLRTVHLKTSGMHCVSCAQLVDITLKDLEGVRESKTSFASGATEVVFDSDAVTVGELVRAIRGAGYDAERAV